MCFAARPHVQIILTPMRKLEFLLIAFAVIVTAMALLIVPKVNFDSKVMMYITIFVSSTPKN